MANLRVLKKDIDYLIEEVLSDSYLTMYFRPEKSDNVLKIMQKAVDQRNALYDRANNPPARGGRLVRKHYTTLRHDLMTSAENLFSDLSALSK